MPKFNYAKIQSTAVKVLDKFGKPGKILRFPDWLEDTAEMVMSQYTDRQVDGTRILQTDKLIVVSARKTNGTPLALPQAERDRLEFPAGTIYEIISVNEVNPTGDLPLLYEIQARA